MKTNPLIILLLLFVIGCDSKQDWRADLEKVNEQEELRMADSKAKIRSYMKDSYTIETGFSSKEEALLAFLTEVQKTTGFELKTIFTSLEKETVLFPNTLGFGTALDVTPLEEYKKLIQERENMGIERLREKMQGGSFSLTEIKWEKPRIYNKINGYKPHSIELTIKGKQVKVDQVKMIFEVNGKYKVGVIAP